MTYKKEKVILKRKEWTPDDFYTIIGAIPLSVGDIKILIQM